MKIYTKKGDKGKTQLLGGTMVDKFDSKIEAYGNIDELNSFIGHLHDQDIDKNHKEFPCVCSETTIKLRKYYII